MVRWIVCVLPMLGCDGLLTGTDDVDLPPPPITARFSADAILQDCYWGGESWLGVESLRLTLEHRLEGAVSRDVPAPGTCTSDVELYAEQALDGGDPVPGLSERPGWTGPEGSGRLPVVVPGLWHGDAFAMAERCGILEDTVGDGVELTDAGSLSGFVTPAVQSIENSLADGVLFEDHAPVLDGDTVALTWDAEGWDRAFVQVWREYNGEVREIITCGVQGDAFTIDDAVWSVTNDNLITTDNRLVVGVVRDEVVELPDGSARVQLSTRALHVMEPR
ncbi:MAG: hypothetical protein AB8H79_09960 [Myxococcota bacterium]